MESRWAGSWRWLELVLILVSSFCVSRLFRTYLRRKRAGDCASGASRSCKSSSSDARHRQRCGERLVCLSVGKFEQALDLYQEAKAMGFLPVPLPERVTKALSLAAIRANRPELVFTFVRDFQLNSLMSPDLPAALIKSVTARNLHKEALAFHDQLFNRHSATDGQSSDSLFSCLLYCAVEAQEPWRAKPLFARIQNPTNKDTGNLVRALCMRGEIAQAKTLVDEQDVLEPHVLLALAVGHVKTGDFNAADLLVAKIAKKIDSNGLAVLLRAVATSEPSKAGVNFAGKWLKLQKSGEELKCSSDTFAGLAVAFDRFSGSRIDGLLAEGKLSVTPEALELAIFRLIKENARKAAMQLLKRLCNVSTDCGVVVIAAALQEGEAETRVAVKLLTQRGFQVDAIVVIEVLQKCFFSKDRTNPVSMFKTLCEFAEPNSVAVNLVLAVLLEDGGFSLAYDFIHEVLPSVHFEPGVTEFFALYAAAVTNGKLFIARETLAALIHFHNSRVSAAREPLISGEEVVAAFLGVAEHSPEAVADAKNLFQTCKCDDTQTLDYAVMREA